MHQALSYDVQYDIIHYLMMPESTMCYNILYITIYNHMILYVLARGSAQPVSRGLDLLHTYMHTCIYAPRGTHLRCIYQYLHTYILSYTNLHTYMHLYMHAYIHTYIHTTSIYPYIQTCIHDSIYAYIHTYSPHVHL